MRSELAQQMVLFLYGMALMSIAIKIVWYTDRHWRFKKESNENKAENTKNRNATSFSVKIVNAKLKSERSEYTLRYLIEGCTALLMALMVSALYLDEVKYTLTSVYASALLSILALILVCTMNLFELIALKEKRKRFNTTEEEKYER